MYLKYICIYNPLRHGLPFKCFQTRVPGVGRVKEGRAGVGRGKGAEAEGRAGIGRGKRM
jgi:hypothetical protein